MSVEEKMKEAAELETPAPNAAVIVSEPDLDTLSVSDTELSGSPKKNSDQSGRSSDRLMGDSEDQKKKNNQTSECDRCLNCIPNKFEVPITDFLKKDGPLGKPIYLWCFWVLSIFMPVLCTAVAMADDDLIVGSLSDSVVGDLDLYCGAIHFFSESRSGKSDDISYGSNDCESGRCQSMATVGQVWLAFNAIGLLFYLVLAGLSIQDGRKSEFGASKRVSNPCHGCFPLLFSKECSVTVIVFITAFFCQMMAIIVLACWQRCSNESFWKINLDLDEVKDFQANGGVSMAFVFIGTVSSFFGIVAVISVHLPETKTESLKNETDKKYDQKSGKLEKLSSNSEDLRSRDNL